MGPFMLIRDGQRITLQMREMPDSRYGWFLFAADCRDLELASDRLIARSTTLAGEAEAKKAGMKALLEQQQRISFTPIRSEGVVEEDVTATTRKLEPCRVDELVENITRRLDELDNAIRLIRARVQVVKPPATASQPPSALGQIDPKATVDGTWRLFKHDFLLVSPDDICVTLTEAETQFMLALFGAPTLLITYEDARRAIAKSGKDASSRASLVVLVSRMRSKCRERGITLPLHVLRGAGYSFAAECAVVQALR